MPNALSVANGAAAGTGPPAAVIVPPSRDDSGLVYLGTGTATTTGTLATISFGANYSAPDGSSVPKVVGAFQGSHLPTGITYSVTTSSIVISCPSNAPTASLAATQAGGIVFCWRKDW